jgi:hypothetical protein
MNATAYSATRVVTCHLPPWAVIILLGLAMHSPPQQKMATHTPLSRWSCGAEAAPSAPASRTKPTGCGVAASCGRVVATGGGNTAGRGHVSNFIDWRCHLRPEGRREVPREFYPTPTRSGRTAACLVQEAGREFARRMIKGVELQTRRTSLCALVIPQELVEPPS